MSPTQMSRLAAADEVHRRTLQRIFDLGRDKVKDYQRTMHEILDVDEELKAAYAGVRRKAENPPPKTLEVQSSTAPVMPSVLPKPGLASLDLPRKTAREWYRIRAQADSDIADIYIYDVIGKSWFDESVSAKQFLEDIKSLPESAKMLRVHVNSPGGDPFDASAIHNLLRSQAKEKKRTIEVLIEGLAASAATIVTSAGDTIKIARNALFMIHNPSGFALGDADDMKAMASALEAITDSIVASYQRVSSLSAEEIKALMAAETWMDAEEAVTKGFATDLMESAEVAAEFSPRAFERFSKVPDRFRVTREGE